jgi:transketolase
MASLVPLDRDAVLEAAAIGPVVTVEDHHIDTGLGAMVALVLAESGKPVPFKRCGVQGYGGSGQPAELYAKQGLDAGSIAKVVKGLL